MAIVKMKKLRAFAMQSDKDALLHELQLMGSIEVSQLGEKLDDPQWAGLVKKGDSSSAEYKSLFTRLGAAVKALDKYAYIKTGLFKNRREVGLSEFFDESLPGRALNYVKAIEDAESRLMKLYADEGRLKSIKASLELWLPLDVPLESTDTAYVSVQFGTIPAVRNLDDLINELKEASESFEIYEAGKDREQQGLLVLCHKDFITEVNAVIKKYGFNRVYFKDIKGTAKSNCDLIDTELKSIGQRIEETLKELEELGNGRDDIKLYYDRVAQIIISEEAKENLVLTDKAFAIEGWVAVSDTKALQKVLEKYNCAYELSEPEPDDNVPIKLKNNSLTAPLNMVTEMYSLPSYDGIDPNPLIMPFFTLFFGIMYNDMGYGLVLILISVIVRAKVKLRGTMKYMMGLMTLCGITSAFVGALTGSFFGDAIPTVAGIFGREINLPYLFSPMEEPLLVLIGAIVIGMIQIIVGMAINAYMLIRDGHPLDALFDIGSWWLLFAGIAVLALGGTYWVALAGVAMLVLTQGRQKPTIAGKIIGGFASLYNITSYFGDILSYSRLMALMLAGGVIATVVNMLGALPGNIFFYIVIFLIGHVFNMGINIIGTYVHASRLQYLEYFGKFYRDGGKPFAPFALKTKYVDIIKEEN